MTHRFLFILWGVIMLLSCSNDESDCGNYLNTYNDYQAFYNTDGRIAGYTLEDDTVVKFEYNEKNQLATRWDGAIKTVYQYYREPMDKVTGIQFYDMNNTPTNLITFEYNQQGLIYRIFYFPPMIPHSVIEPSTYIEYEYTGKNPTTMKNYGPEKKGLELELYSTIVYEFDTKKKPYSLEMNPLSYAVDPRSMQENNVTKSIRHKEGYPDDVVTYTYDYNAAGYPIRVSANGTLLEQFSYTCEPVSVISK